MTASGAQPAPEPPTRPLRARAAGLRLLIGSRGLEGSAITLAFSTGVTGVLGLAYWMIAENFYPTAEIGRASAVMSTATMLSSLSGLALGGMYERYLVDSGFLRLRLVLGGLAATTLIGALVGAAFLFIGPTASLFSSSEEAFFFPVTVAVLTLYALLDPVMVALGRPRWLATKNILLSVAKIVPAIPLAGWGTALALTGSWTVLAALAAGIGAIAVVHLIRHLAPSQVTLPPWGELVRHHGAVASLMAMGILAPLFIPLIVISVQGAEAAAHFNIAWILVSSVGLILTTMMSSFVVEASGITPHARHALLCRMVRVSCVMAVICVGGLAAFGPLVLTLAGPEYLDAVGYLLLMVPALLLQQVLSYFGALSRLAGRLRLLVVIQVIGVIGMVGGSFVLVGPLGITGVGIAFLATDLLCVGIVVAPLLRLARQLRA